MKQSLVPLTLADRERIWDAFRAKAERINSALRANPSEQDLVVLAQQEGLDPRRLREAARRPRRISLLRLVNLSSDPNVPKGTIEWIKRFLPTGGRRGQFCSTEEKRIMAFCRFLPCRPPRSLGGLWRRLQSDQDLEDLSKTAALIYDDVTAVPSDLRLFWKRLFPDGFYTILRRDSIVGTVETMALTAEGLDVLTRTRSEKLLDRATHFNVRQAQPLDLYIENFMLFDPTTKKPVLSRGRILAALFIMRKLAERLQPNRLYAMPARHRFLGTNIVPPIVAIMTEIGFEPLDKMEPAGLWSADAAVYSERLEALYRRFQRSSGGHGVRA